MGSNVGKSLPPTILNADFQFIFWGHAKAQPNGCWEWTSGQSRGYGKLTHGGENFRAHRVAWSIANNDLETPAGQDVEHICHNALCIRPSHLRCCTHKENVERSSRDGRLGHSSRYDQRKLTDHDVVIARTAHANGIPMRKIGDMYGITVRAVFDIVHQRTYKNVA